MRSIQIITIVLSLDLTLFAQGTFTNLDFESSVPPIQGGGFPPDLLGWRAYTSALGYNTISLGGAAVNLHDASSPYFAPLVGNYSVVLVNGVQPPIGDAGIAEIGQAGTIPSNSRSLIFVATSLSPVVTFSGTPIGLSIVNSTARYNVFAGDITALAGQSGELRFSQTGLFDHVAFSTLPVPEPGVVALLLGGTAILGFRIRWRR